MNGFASFLVGVALCLGLLALGTFQGADAQPGPGPGPGGGPGGGGPGDPPRKTPGLDPATLVGLATAGYAGMQAYKLRRK